jgi:transcription elongation factor Elf1
MNSNHTSVETFRKIQEDQQNTICFDCGHNDITHCSLSLGILLCKGCATVHRALIPEISTVKLIDTCFTMIDMQSLLMGGNASLKSFFAMYSISCNDSIEYKYRTKACAYYKEMLKMMVNNSPCTMFTPSESEGADLCPEYSSSLYSEGLIDSHSSTSSTTHPDPTAGYKSPLSQALHKVASEVREKGLKFISKFRKSN